MSQVGITPFEGTASAQLRRRVLLFRGSNHIDASINLVLRSALLRASRRTATSEVVPAAILRDGASRLLRMRSLGEASSAHTIGWWKRSSKWRSRGRYQSLAGRHNPSVTPQHNRVDSSQSWHRVAAGGFPSAKGSVQHGRAINYTSQSPSADGTGTSLWEGYRWRRYLVLLFGDGRLRCCRAIVCCCLR